MSFLSSRISCRGVSGLWVNLWSSVFLTNVVYFEILPGEWKGDFWNFKLNSLLLEELQVPWSMDPVGTLEHPLPD